MQLILTYYLAICVCFAYAISDEEFQNFKTEVSTHMAALENQINDGLGQIQDLTIGFETVSSKLNESDKALEDQKVTHENEIQDLRLQVKRLKLLTKLIGPETCLEMSKGGIDESMNVMLDPDGKNQGLPPMNITCQMPEGKSILGQEVIAVVNNCDTTGCYKKDLDYDAPMGQIEALISRSSACSQTVKIECTSAPIVDLYENENRMAWIDRHGTEHQFTVVGNNNCDARKPFLVTDHDEITDTEKLPILGFSYGPLTHEAEKMTISIGPLVCEPANDVQEYRIEDQLKELQIKMNDTIAKIDTEHESHRDKLEKLDEKLTELKESKLDNPCPVGNNYHLIHGKCYYISKNKKSAEDADRFCKTTFNGQGQLFEPRSLDVNKKVHKFALSIKNDHFWVGLNDKVNEKSWVYNSDGSPIVPSALPFKSGQPSSGTSQNCMMYYVLKGEPNIGEVGDYPCTGYSHSFICERAA